MRYLLIITITFSIISTNYAEAFDWKEDWPWVAAAVAAIGGGAYLLSSSSESAEDSESSSDTPSPKNHNAAFLFAGAKTRMMNILSTHITRDQFKGYVNTMKGSGANFAYLYTMNQGDGPWTPQSFYQGHDIGGTINESDLDEMKQRMQYIRDQGMGIIIWLRADDSGGFNRTSKAKQEKYQADVVEHFDKYASAYVVGLEADEYMNASSTNSYAAQLQSLTSKEIGVHLTGGNISHCLQPNIDACYYQYGFDKTASQIESDTRDKVGKLGGKPLYAAEYHLSSGSAAAKALGDAAMKGGAQGTGNNRNL